MKQFIVFLGLLIVFVSCKQDAKKMIVTSEKKAATELKIKLYNYEQLAPLLAKKDAKTYVVNFWATWCKPCVKELPYFEKLYATYKKKNVEVVLVSLDFPNQVESRLIPFVKKKQLQSKVVLMADPDQDTWIPKIDKDWSGAIPATLIYNKESRVFYEKSFHYDELEKEVLKFLK
ncbi:MAG: TlpA family protein disulfide reductase [Flavobacteriaceae bacterium]|nr:TlpA family protein disulfide reductase [Flavobacteriaceae bacterium]